MEGGVVRLRVSIKLCVMKYFSVSCSTVTESLFLLFSLFRKRIYMRSRSSPPYPIQDYIDPPTKESRILQTCKLSVFSM